MANPKMGRPPGGGPPRIDWKDPAQVRKYKAEKAREYYDDPDIAEKRREYGRNRAREWYLRNPDAYWVHGLKKTHGLTPDQWHAIFMEQQGLCYLGGHPLPDDRKKIVVDHDHSHCGPMRSCGICRRGLACSNCNTLIGMGNDDPQLLRTIADNLERQNAITKALIMAAPKQDELF